MTIGFSTSVGILFRPWHHAYVTYYQAWGLSGHTSPCGECAYFIAPYTLTVGHNYYCTRVTYISFQKYKWAHLIRKEIFFL